MIITKAYLIPLLLLFLLVHTSVAAIPNLMGRFLKPVFNVIQPRRFPQDHNNNVAGAVWQIPFSPSHHSQNHHGPAAAPLAYHITSAPTPSISSDPPPPPPPLSPDISPFNNHNRPAPAPINVHYTFPTTPNPNGPAAGVDIRSYSPPAPPPSTPDISSFYGPAPAPQLGSHENSVSPPPPPDTSYFYGPGPAPLPYAPTSAEEIHWVKQYLSNYGYMLYTDDDPYNEDESLDTETISAIKDYQKFFNLKVTGNLDYDTLQRMKLLRCGVPDKNFTYDLSTTNNNMSWPLGTKWFPNSRNLTYGFAPANELPEEIIKVFRDSFQLWSEAIGLVNLTETTYVDADIKIGFRDFSDEVIGPEVVGGTLIEMKTRDNDNDNDNGSQLPNNNNNVTFGNIVLVGGKFWALPNYSVSKLSWKQNVVDLKSVVMHQIGHVLGLEHSSNEDSVMYPSVLPSMQRKVELSEDDKEQIQQLYLHSSSFITSGSSSGAVGNSGWGLLLILTLSFGFACMLILF